MTSKIDSTGATATDPGSTVSWTIPPSAGTQPLLQPGASCPVTAATVISIVGVRMYGEQTDPPGSCVFDSKAGGSGITASEIRVDIQTETDDLAALYRFFAQRSASGFPRCHPFELVRRPDFGPAGFETLCGAAPTTGPSSADDFLPTQDSGALTVTVNRGVAVADHRVSTCAAQAAAVLGHIRSSW